MKFSSGNFLNNTNNQLECINQKLKSVITHYSSLEQLVEKFIVVIRVLRAEREHKAAMVAQRVPVVFHSTSDEALVSYMKHLTTYAYQFVAKQLQLSSKLEVIVSADGSATVSGHSANFVENNYNVSL